MKWFIIAFGGFIAVMAGAMAIRPAAFMDYMLKHAGDMWFHVLAAGMRIVLGIVLILYAPESRFPLVLQILGWIALVAGIVLAVLPPSRFKQLMGWVVEKFRGFVRIAAMAAILFGAFLIYAVT